MGYTTGARANLIAITGITGPGPNAKHTRTAFEPDYEYQDAEIARIYFESGRCHTYLGDWHTHPNSVAALSKKDKKALGRIALHKEARAPNPIMAILGSGKPWRLRIWRFDTRSILRLKCSQYLELQVRTIPG
jgi:integrative and conjugative element protein (TIGR02256 family)